MTTKPVIRVDGREKVSGTATYAADVRLPGLLLGSVLRSPHPHARILSVDASAAKNVPGVHAVLTAADLPPVLVGKRLRDMPLLARDRVRFVGEKVVAVAAETRDIAEEALQAIAVDYEELPAVFDPEEALQEGAPVLHPEFHTYPKPDEWIKSDWRGTASQDFRSGTSPNASSEVVLAKGDVKTGFEFAEKIFEDTFRIPMQHHGFIEPHASTVAIDPSGGVRVWSCIKYPYELHESFAQASGVSAENVVIMPVRVGADFGGKGFMLDEALGYYLARASARPVQMVHSQNEEFIAGIHRHGGMIRIRSGVDEKGRLTAREVTILFNGGAYAGFRPRMTLGGVPRAAGCYRIPHVRVIATCVYTNQVPCGHMRAPGQPQIIFAVESHTDRIARQLGVDPVEFRLRNVLRDGDEGPLGGVFRNVNASEVVDRAARGIGWGTPKKEGTGRGLSLSERSTGTGRATVRVELDERGQVAVHTGVMEVGTGSHTVLREVVGRVLSLDPLDIRVVQGDTKNGPFDVGSGGSKVTNTTGGAARVAAEKLRTRLCEMAATIRGWPTDQVKLERGYIACRGKGKRVSLRDLGRKLVKEQGGPIFAEAENRSGRGESSGYACHAVEVAVDRETGQVRINRAVAVHDVGFVVNPSGLAGQIEGGFSQGLGMGIMEDLKLEEGRLQTVNYGDYKIPCAADMPPMSVRLLEKRDGPGPFGAKGVGEIAAIPAAAAVANAVEDAVGVRIFDPPVNAEKVWKSLSKRSRD